LEYSLDWPNKWLGPQDPNFIRLNLVIR
jgi:hypothetical protein